MQKYLWLVLLLTKILNYWIWWLKTTGLTDIRWVQKNEFPPKRQWIAFLISFLPLCNASPALTVKWDLNLVIRLWFWFWGSLVFFFQSILRKFWNLEGQKPCAEEFIVKEESEGSIVRRTWLVYQVFPWQSIFIFWWFVFREKIFR